MAALGGPAACTIIARNYLSHATILAESYLRHEPAAHFYLLVVDGLPPGVVLPEGVRVVEPGELGLRSFFDMCFKYDVTELCTAVKPAFLSLLLSRYAESAVIFLDPDILVLRPLHALKAALASADIVLIPHLLHPIPKDGLKPTEQTILIAGAYNLGFLALKASEEASRLLEWWTDRLEDGCRVAPAEGLFVDQRWMDLAPGLFPSTAVLRDPTYDVAYWNLHSRPLDRRQGEFLVAGEPLVFFHFSGFDPSRPQSLSKHQTRISVPKSPPLAELLEWYADLHRQHGYATHSQAGYGYSRFSNDVTVSPIFRRLYLELPEPDRPRFGNPFEADGAASFFGWATQWPAEPRGLSPFLEALYRIRPDLPAIFPDVRGQDHAAFLEWARTDGAREMGYPAEIAVPAVAAAGRPQARAAGLLGVNVAGYLRNETGLGALARGYVAALRAAGVPVALKDVSELSPNRSQDATLSDFHSVHPHPVNLVCVNADSHFGVASHLGGSFFRDRYNIGVWAWELPEFPPEWHDRFTEYDEVWAATSFIANSLAPVSPIPIVRMPPVLTVPRGGSRERGRARLQVEDDTFVWLFVFDLRSYCARKNPLGLIEAFGRAFAPSDRVRLVIKCTNAHVDGEALAAMKAAARGKPVSIHQGYWTVDEMLDLLAACDGYASLHRSEGIGVPLGNAMGLGKPVVATGWSGNMEFMNVSNSFPVRYQLVRLERDVGPYRAGSTWAEPSVEHAAELLRRVFEGGPEVAAVAAAGRRTVEEEYSVEKIAERMQERLSVIDDRLSPRLRPAPTPSTATLGAPVLPRLDLQNSQHGWLGRCVKRAVGFLVRYHTYHQQRVNTILATSVGHLGARLDALAGRLAVLSDENERARAEHRDGLEAATRAMAAIAGCLDAVRATIATLEAGADRAGRRSDGVQVPMEALQDQAGELGAKLADLLRHLADAERRSPSIKTGT